MIHPRLFTYLATALALVLLSITLRGIAWHGDAELHTIMEVAAALIALAVGGLALLRYHSLKHATFLFVGMGFLGTALLDAYHAAVTSRWFAAQFSSGLDSLIPWSWTASRVFLSQFLCLSYLAWWREQRVGHSRIVNEKVIYATAAVMTIASFFFFAFVPLPLAYYEDLFFHRPGELLAALFFVLALAGYVHKGEWRTNPIEHWLVLALVVSVVIQVAFMSFSNQLFDSMFDVAHLLKKVSYALVLVGLAVSIYQLHKSEVANARQLQRANEDLRAEAHLRLAENSVREHIADMETPEDLGVVLDELRLQLQRLGVEYDGISLQIFNEDGDDFVSVFSKKDRSLALEKLVNRAWPRTSDNVEKYPWVREVWQSNKTHYQPRVTDGESWVQGVSIVDVPFSQGTLAINRRDGSGFSPEQIDLLEKMATVLSEGFNRFIDLTVRGQMRRQLEQIMLDAHCIIWEADITVGESGQLVWETKVHNEEAAQSFFPLDTTDSVNYVQAWYLGRSPEERARTDVNSTRAIKGGEMRYNQQFFCVDRDGQTHWFVEDAHIQKLGDNYWKVTGVANEITEMHQAEERFSAAIQHVVDAFVIIDDQCAIQVFNPAAEQIFGYTAAEAIGQNVALLIPEPFSSEHDNYIARYKETGVKNIIGTSREVEARRRDGSLFPVRLSVGEFALGGRRMFTGTMQDISERKREEAEQTALHQMRERVWNMQTSGDIDEVLRAVWESIETMGIDFDHCGINIAEDIADENTAFLMYALSHDGQMAQTGRHEGVEPLTTIWRQGKHAYRPDLQREDPHGELSVLNQHFDGVRCVADVPFRSGTLAINSRRANAFSEADIQSLKRLGQVLDEAFRRIGDIRVREQYYIDLEREIVDRQLAQEELKVALLEAEGANLAKSQFLANMSHEIRTPMNAIMGMTDLVLRTQLDADQRDNLEVVRLSAQNLLDLINDILDLSRIEARGLTLEETDFSLHQILRDTTRTFTARAREKGLSLDLAMDDALPDALRGDPMRLRQILVNLIGNALKFTSEGGIEVRAFAQAAKSGFELHCSVRDSGIGMSPEQQERIFEAFAQADTSTTRRYGGSGLGLAISVNLVKLMGGRIWVDSAVGEGSTFHFIVHLEQALQDPPLAAPAPVEKDHFASRHILLAEDNPLNQKVAVGLLREAGHEITVVNNGLEAVAALSAGTFDIVLMDVQMPEMDGLAATQLIRQNEGETGGHTPIIALTAHAMKGDRERCLAAGMDDYISKPIDRKKILALIEELTDREATFAIDGEALMGRLGGEYALFAQLRDLFRESSKRLLAQMQRAVASGDFADLHTAACELHDTIIHFGADSAVRLTFALQEVTGGEDSSGLTAMLSRLESELAQVDRALAEFEQMREGLIPNSARAMQWPRLEENTLAELRRLEQGGYFSLGDFLRQFNIDGRARIDKMRQAVVDGDTATLEREAHTLKGGSRELGARYLSELCFELEKMSRAGEGMGEAGAQQVRSIAEEFAAVCNELVRRREG